MRTELHDSGTAPLAGAAPSCVEGGGTSGAAPGAPRRPRPPRPPVARAAQARVLYPMLDEATFRRFGTRRAGRLAPTGQK